MTRLRMTNIIGAIMLSGGTSAMAEDVHLTMESWRNDDLIIWQDNSGF